MGERVKMYKIFLGEGKKNQIPRKFLPLRYIHRCLSFSSFIFLQCSTICKQRGM